MTFKAAAADLPVGGGKIVLVESSSLRPRRGPPRPSGAPSSSSADASSRDGTWAFPSADGAFVRSETSFMVDESDAGVGDLNRATAIGVEAGARAALAFATGASSWPGWNG